jgi:hypothetical protein
MGNESQKHESPKTDNGPHPPQDQQVAVEYPDAPGSLAAQREKSNIATLKDGLDLFGKLIFGFAGLCYVLGVVVVTIHLREYGVNSLDLSQLHYVTAGVWVMLPIAFITTFAIFSMFVAAAQTEETQTNLSQIERIYTALATIFTLFVGLRFFWSKIGVEFSWKNAVLIPLLGILATLIIFAGAFSAKTLTRTTPRRTALKSLGIMALGLGVFATYVLLFAQYTYQSIPWATGGGRASTVRLFLTPESAPYLQGLNVAVAKQTDATAETGSIQLLLTTEKQFVIINNEGRAVSLPAEIVKGISYEK